MRWITTIILHSLSYLLVIFTAPISLFFVLRRIKEYERAVVLGTTLSPVRKALKFIQNVLLMNIFPAQAVVRGPGLIFVLPFLEKIKRVDTRTQVFEVPPQQILSTDSVTLTVDAVIYYRVFDPVRAACKLQDYNIVSGGMELEISLS